jgi:hypothetical protein
VEATVCVPSGRRPVQGVYCPTVKGTFAAQALDRNDDNWWGGQELGAPYPADARGVPPELTGMKRYLAEEYLRQYRGPAAPARRRGEPARPPAPQAPQAPQAPPAPTDAAPPPGNGNGNGNGNGQDEDRD